MLRTPFVFAALILALLVVLLGSVSAQQDITPPHLVDVQFEPRFIDTGDGPKTIAVTIHVTDDLSGLDYGFLVFRMPDTAQRSEANFGPGYGREPVTGDLRDGTYVVNMTMPQYSAYGKWVLTSVGMEDNVGNLTNCYRPGIAGDGPGDPPCDAIRFDDYYFYIGDEPPTPQNRAVFLPLMR